MLDPATGQFVAVRQAPTVAACSPPKRLPRRPERRRGRRRPTPTAATRSPASTRPTTSSSPCTPRRRAADPLDSVLVQTQPSTAVAGPDVPDPAGPDGRCDEGRQPHPGARRPRPASGRRAGCASRTPTPRRCSTGCGSSASTTPRCCGRRRAGRSPAGAAEEVALEFVIPDAFAAGHHSVAVEVVSDRPGVRAGDRRRHGHRRHDRRRRDRRRAVDDPRPTGAARSGSTSTTGRTGRSTSSSPARAPTSTIRLRPDRLVLRPGERVRTAGKVKGPRHLVGEPLQHSMTVTARSASAPSYAPATFQQRPAVPARAALAARRAARRRRSGPARVGAGVPVVGQPPRRGGATPPAELVDTDGDGLARHAGRPADRHRRRRRARHAGRRRRRAGRRRRRARRAAGGRVGPADAHGRRAARSRPATTGDDAGVDRHADAAGARRARRRKGAAPAGSDRQRRAGPRRSSCGRPGSAATSRRARRRSARRRRSSRRPAGPDGAWLFADVADRPELRG